MNRRVYNALRKLAAVPQSGVLYPTPLWSSAYENAYDNEKLTKDYNLPTGGYNLDYDRGERPAAVNWLASDYPGSKPKRSGYSKTVQYFMDRHKPNIYKYLNRSNPRTNPVVPKIIKGREQ
jgi:hypothetical protein